MTGARRHHGPGGDAGELLAGAHAMGVTDPRVLDAMRTVPRERFVPAAGAPLAYVDEPIPLPHAQVTTQPSLVAVMLEALTLTGDETVLEVGTGHGYETALLAALVREVWSVEWWADLAATARDNLAAYGVRNAHVVVGDGGAGLPDHAPYAGIVVAAAAPRPPQALVAQLAEGGRLVLPVGRGGHEDVRVYVKKRGRLLGGRTLLPARFVPLVGPAGAEGPAGEERQAGAEGQAGEERR